MARTHSKFIGRELSDLAFAGRVLEEAANPANPALERVRFLALTEMLLDEFYRYRVCELRAAIRGGRTGPGPFGLTPERELQLVDEHSNRLLHRQVEAWEDVKQALRKAGIAVVRLKDLKPRQRGWIARELRNLIVAKTRPAVLGPNDPLPFIPNGTVALAVEFADRPERAIVPLPPGVPRFLSLGREKGKYVLVESALVVLLPEIFPGREIGGAGLFRVIREGDLKLTGEQDDLPALVRNALHSQARSDFIRLKVNKAMPESLCAYLAGKAGLLDQAGANPGATTDDATSSEFVAVDGLLGLADSLQLIDDLAPGAKPECFFPKRKRRRPEGLGGKAKDIFSALERGDILVHVPFEKFKPVIDLVRQAARDEATERVRCTIYRVGNRSALVKALVKAAKAGIRVDAVIELEAREDERHNLGIASRLRKAGANVYFGFRHKKVHAKLIEVIRRTGAARKSYMVFGTGNFHTGTAKLYTDLFLLTADPRCREDCEKLFGYICHGAPPKGLKAFTLAPLGLRRKLLSLVRREIARAREGKPAAIILKMNKLADPELIEALYAASNAGVKVELIVRGICCLRPGVKGQSENIRVRSVVGRFLEHERIFFFANGFPLESGRGDVFLSSADWITHKVDKRVELMVPVRERRIRQKIITRVLEPYLKDRAQSWFLGADGRYRRKSPGRGYSAHEALFAD